MRGLEIQPRIYYFVTNLARIPSLEQKTIRWVVPLTDRLRSANSAVAEAICNVNNQMGREIDGL